MNRQRMDAEDLARRRAGRCRRAQPEDGWQACDSAAHRRGEDGNVGLNQWPVSLDPAEHDRRSVYLYVKRSFPYPMFAIFDAPDSAVSCPRRDTTTVAPQALALLNSEFMLAQARKLCRARAEGEPRRSGGMDRGGLAVGARTRAGILRAGAARAASWPVTS